MLAPNGNHVTWGEFSNVTGKADVVCMEKGTLAALELDGLIPNGLYTIWNIVLGPPGFDGSLESLGASIVGANPLGLNEGTRNDFRASSTGHGFVSAITPPESMLRLGSEDIRGIKACALDEFEYHVVGAYHIDDLTHGIGPGPIGTAVDQFGFVFRNE